jgi:uncharacterized RDD family membrane protein YckC
MKCPKCHYVSFEPEPRCRHCGYGFSLADADRAAALADDNDAAGEVTTGAQADPVRVPLLSRPAVPEPQPRAPIRPLMRVEAPAPAEASRVRRSSAAGAAVADEPRPQLPSAAVPPAVPAWETDLVRTPPVPTTELPLFVKAVAASQLSNPADVDLAQDEPLVRVPVEPRAPLSVRRPAPDPSAHRAAPPPTHLAPRKLGPLDRDLLEDLQRIELAELTARARSGSLKSGVDRVGAGTRLAAAALDALIIGGLSVAVLAITLRWCDLAFGQASTLPMLPMLAFHGLVGAGYLLMFTAAGGQTVGKMAFGLRVVDDTPAARPSAVTLSQAAYRVVVSLPSVLALGLGFIPALVGTERAIHDRLAHTRVVRA